MKQMKQMKRIIAGALAVLMVYSMVPTQYLMASDVTTVEQEQEQETTDNDVVSEIPGNPEIMEEPQMEEPQTQEIQKAEEIPSDIAEIPKSEEALSDVEVKQGEQRLNYLYVESPYIQAPSEQNILVSWGDGTEHISDMTLCYQKDGGEKGQFVNASQDKEVFLFNKSFAESDKGVYQITGVTYTQDGQAYEVIFQDLSMSAFFGVNEEYEGYEPSTGERISAEEKVDVNIASVGEDGSLTDQKSIEEALDAAINDVGATENAEKGRAATRASNRIIVLDPGHDATHAGAQGNGLREEVLSLKIATYCKAELEQYAGVTVYLTRGSACPYPGTSSTVCNRRRIQDAVNNKKASVYVSLHMNSSEASSANGAEVYYPNSSWKPGVGAEGKGLAQEIQNKLAALGLSNRGIKFKDSDDGGKYDDGSVADYFTVQNECKELGIPGLIVEHAFISNSSDANNFLKTEAGLKKLGVADAAGIAAYYGLSKTGNLTLDTTKYAGEVGDIYQFLASGILPGVTPSVSTSDSDIVSVKLKDPNDPRGYLYEIKGLKPGSAVIKVSAGGQTASFVATIGYDYTLDTVKLSYPEGNIYQFLAKITDKNNGTPTASSSNTSVATVKLIDAKDSRGYLFQVDLLKQGTTTISVNYKGVIRSFPVTVTAETILNLDTVKYDGTTGDIYHFLAKTNNRGNLPVVTTSNPAVVSVKLKDAKDARGFLYEIQGLKPGSAEIVVTLDGKKASFPVTYKAVDFELDTTSHTNSEGNIYWFLAKITDKSKGTPTVSTSNASVATVKLIDANDSRGYLYQLNLLKRGTAIISVTYLGTTKSFPVTVTMETTLQLDTTKYDGTAGDIYQFLAKTNNRESLPQVTSSDSKVVSVKLKDANDSRGYLYEIQGLKAGTARITVTVADKTASFPVTYKAVDYTLDTTSHTNSAGNIYWFLAKITDKSKGAPTVSSSDPSVAGVKLIDDKDARGFLYQVDLLKQGSTTINVTYWGTTRSFPVTVTGETTLTLDTTKYDGTAGDIYQFLAKTNNRGSLPQVVSSNPGVVSVKLKDANDSRGFLYEIQGLKEGTAEITVTLTGNKVSFPVTYRAVDFSLDTTQLTYDVGKIYQFLAKITDKSKGTPTVTSSDTSVASAKLVNDKDSRGYLFQVDLLKKGKTTISVNYFGTVRSFPVTVVGPETTLTLDTEKYNGTAGDIYQFLAKTNNRKLTPKVTASDSGVVSVKLKDGNDSRGFLYEIQGLKAGAAEILVELDGKKASFPVTYKAVEYSLDAGDMNYYAGDIFQFLAKITDKSKGTPSVASSDTKIATVKIVDAGDGRGYLYQVNTLRTGKVTISVNYFGTVKSFQMNVIEPQLHLIEGEQIVNSIDLVNYFNRKGQVYPEFYKTSDAPTLAAFCQIYYEEARAEGIKVEVAFTQAMNETGWLKYGGDVKREQYNFAGIGAVGGGAGGASFANVREGVRAQIQHLKAYGSTKPLVNSCVDPRFGFVTRGSAKYVEWLGIQENPTGAGWASSPRYGYTIVNMMQELLK